jgi:rhodanese-related sulfurtransferase
MKTITPAEAQERKSKGHALFLDVRTPAEIRECSMGDCTSVPHDKVAHCPDLEKLPRDQSIVLVCGSGQRATMAGKALAEKGFTNLVVMEGGMQEWRKNELPVLEGKAIMSLERQVRIAAGSLVAIGTVLCYFHPAWLILPAFVGSGLVFAGLTNSCGMGAMIATMPWNQ